MNKVDYVILRVFTCFHVKTRVFTFFREQVMRFGADKTGDGNIDETINLALIVTMISSYIRRKKQLGLIIN